MSTFPQNPNGSATSANSSPVVIASDQGAVPITVATIPSHAVTNAGTFAVQAASTLAAETTKVIGVVRTADGSGNLLTSTTNALDVNIKSGNPTSITANAGTNLNTSALALETGGNLATIATRTPALGQALAAASVPVILPSATVTTLTPPAAITGFALDATLTGGTQQTKITDGTNVATVKAASTLPALTDKAVVTTQRDPLPAGTNVIGHFIADTGSTTAVTGTVTVSGTVTTTPPSNASSNVAQINGVTPLMGNGVTGTGSQRVTIASDNTAFSVNAAATLNAETTKVIGTVNLSAAQTLATVTTVGAVTAITNALPAGTNLMGKVGIDQTTVGTTNGVSIAQIGANTVLTGNGTTGTGSLRVTLASDTSSNTNPLLTTTAPQTSGGLSVYHLISAATTNLQVPKASAGQLYGYMVSNTSAAYSYLCFHNASTTPTAGASIFFKIGIPAGGAANVEFSNGIAFSTGIAISTVTGSADNNTTAVAAGDLVVNLFYK